MLSRFALKVIFFSFENAQRATQAIGMDLRVEDISQPHLGIVKNPAHGYGGAVNPCIDCHLLMLKTAKAIMDAEEFDFVATGEVLESGRCRRINCRWILLNGNRG